MLQSLSRVQKLLLVFGICAAIIAAGKTYHYTKLYTGTDLECRVRGVQLMAAGHNAFVHRGSSGQTEFNGVTVTPPVLWLHYPLSGLSYAQLRMVWLLLQYLLLLGAVLLLVRQLPPGLHTRLFVPLLLTAYFICSVHWQFHAERGQVYVYYLFLFAAMYALYQKNTRPAVFAAGFLLAFAAWGRVLFIVCALPFLMQKNKAFIAGLAAGLAVFGLLSLLQGSQWLDYFAAMNAFTGDGIIASSHTPVAAAGQHPSGAVLPVSFKNDFVTGCINYAGEYLKRLHISLPRQLYAAAYVFFVLVAAALKRKRIAGFTAADSFCFAFLLYIMSEYITGGGRNAYNLVQWLFPLLLILPQCRPRSTAFLLLLAGTGLINAFPLYFPGCFELGELLLIAGATAWLGGSGKTALS